jgi:uncharacterized protein YodC (DUF2158 family)
MNEYSTEEIQVGDVVQLTSGSPRMTVFAIRKGRASVVWNHYETGIIREKTISLKALVKPGPIQRRYVRNDQDY